MYSLLPEFLPLTSIYENLNAQIRSVAIQSQIRVFYHRKIVILRNKSVINAYFPRWSSDTVTSNFVTFEMHG